MHKYLPKSDVYHGKNARQICLKIKIGIKLDYYANNHIICIIYVKLENIELLPFSSEKLMYYIVQMFSRASRNNISIKKLDIYVNTHLICIRYANIYNIKKYALITVFYVVKTLCRAIENILISHDDFVTMQHNTYFK